MELLAKSQRRHIYQLISLDFLDPEPNDFRYHHYHTHAHTTHSYGVGTKPVIALDSVH